MTPRRKKLLDEAVEKAKIHIGHTITTGYGDRAKTFEMKDVSLIGENVMIKVDNEPFPTVYLDSVNTCSCNPKNKTTSEKEGTNE